MLSDKQQSFINTALPRMTIVEGCISSGKRLYNHDKRLFTDSGIPFVPYDKNPFMKSLIKNISKQTNGDMYNITRTMGFNKYTNSKSKFKPIAYYFQDTLDFAAMQLLTGVTDYSTAINQAVSEMAKSGIRTVDYASGISNKVDVAVRRSVMSSIKEMSDRQAESVAEAIGYDVFEISWHGGHRPSHGWGGRRYSLSGSHGYPTPDELFARYGGGRLDDYGCMHKVTPVFPDSPAACTEKELAALQAKEKEITEYYPQRSQYTEAQLEAMKNSDNFKEQDKYNSLMAEKPKKYTPYEARQQQRYMERKMRSARLKAHGQKAAVSEAEKLGQDAESLRASYYGNIQKYNAQMKAYERFIKAMGLPNEKERIYYDGLGRIGGKVPKKYDTTVKKVLNIDNNNVIILKEAKTINDLENFSKQEWGVGNVDLTNLDVEAVKGTFEAMDKTMERYPQLKSKFGEIRQYNRGYMGIKTTFDTKSIIYFNSNDYADKKTLEEEYSTFVAEKYFPQGTTWKDIGVHELGHVMTDVVIEKNHKTVADMLYDRRNHLTAKKIVYDAWFVVRNNYVSKGIKLPEARSSISNYSEKSFSETIAEAFSDVFSNQDSAQPLSKAIVDILDERVK